ncbi:uncharacterized protein [Heterodontus francisci]|uniref:uncharacterized protein isoform X6 n=1 Tax=Heterodontus francisci TaxID=7792 RepID=UPI00355AFC4D
MARVWLAAAREQLKLNQDWQEFSRELFDVILLQLAESHVDLFIDLSASEKALFVERAAKTIVGGNTHRALMSQINSSLEEQIGNHLSGKTLQTKSETVLSHIKDGVVTLLQKWPDMKSKLHLLFNHTFPPDLRKFTWSLYLSNTKVRMEYLSSLSGSPAQSSNNMEISLKCESLLSSEPTFKTLSESKYAAKAMSNVLSYYQKIQPSNNCLSDTNYLLLVPLVQVSITTATQSTTLSLLNTILVEEYLTFMEWWPWYTRLQANRPGEVDMMLRSQAPALTTQQFQKVIKQHFYTSLYKKLNKQDSEVFTVLDPTRVRFPQPWSHLFREQIAKRTLPKERRQAREEREAKHMHDMEIVKQEERLLRLREDEERRREEEHLQRLLAETKRINLEQKFSFKEKLQQERDLRYDMQRKAEEQISQLQVEMRQMMQQRKHSIDAYSQRSFTAPPTSLVSGSSSGFPLPGQAMPPKDSMSTPGSLPVNDHLNTRKAESVTLDLLQNLMHAANSLVNGRGIGEQNLANRIT